MKKTLYAVISALLLLMIFVSCAQENEAVIKSIIHSNPKSQYKCLSYVGKYDGKLYVRTKSQGIISFKIEGSKATDIKELSTGHNTIDYAYINDSTLYGLDRYGVLFTVNLSTGEVKDVANSDYSMLADGYAVKADNALYKIEGGSKIVDGITNLISGHYFRSTVTEGETTTSKLYVYGSAIETPVTGKTIVDVVTDDTNYYIVEYKESAYYVYKISDFTTKIATLSGAPTASIIVGDKIYYKTDSSIDVVDIAKKECTQKTDGWAKNLYTSTTEIVEFIKYGDYILSLNSTGGIMLIDLVKDTATQIFDK